MRKAISIICLILFYTSFFRNQLWSQENTEWTLETTSRENYNGITLSNGRIGIISGKNLFSVNEIILNGVFDKENANGVSRLVRGPVFTNLTFSIDGKAVNEESISDWHQVLDMEHASLKTTINYKEKAQIEYTILALRNMPYMGMVLVEITPKQDIDLKVVNETLFPEELNKTSAQFKLLKDADIELPLYTSKAFSRTGMQELATSSVFLFDTKRPTINAYYNVGCQLQSMGFENRLYKNVKYRFALVGANCSSRDFEDPKSEAERMAIYALQSKIDLILEAHNQQWKELWKSDIIIKGDLQAQRDVRLALYSLYSFSRTDTRLSIPPMGLSSVTGYNGHIFWDAELWMFPSILLMHHDIARSYIDYRSDRLAKARQRANNYGYKGAMFPWESDDSGEESTPTWCLTGPFEHHITADVGIAFWNYYRVTRDKEWLRNEGYKVLSNVADFWASRAIENEDGSFSINNVVGSNEFAPNVNDNAFTNGSAVAVLRYAQRAARELEIPENPLWSRVASGIRFNHDKNGVTMEHSKYNGEIIKQADVNLLAYPLEIETDPEQIKRDLQYYEPRIYEDGPAMGNAILAILTARIGDAEKAYSLFKKSYEPNKRSPFGVLSESAFSNNPYFVTGAGGMLQVVLNGFVGLQITDKGIVQKNPILPPGWKSIKVTGVGVDKRTYIIEKK